VSTRCSTDRGDAREQVQRDATCVGLDQPTAQAELAAVQHGQGVLQSAIVDAVRGVSPKLEAVFDAVYARGGSFVD